MIFQHTWEKVLSGEKTQTRRLVKLGDMPTFISANTWRFHTDPKMGYSGVKNNNRWRWHINQELAIQPGRGQKAIGRLRINYIRREDVREISVEDAKAEGFYERSDFITTWCQMHDKSLRLTWYDCFHWREGRVWKSGYEEFYDYLARCPAERYQAWVIEFQLVQP